MPNPTSQRGQKKAGQKQRRQKKKAKTKERQITPEMEKENVLRYLQDVFKETLDAVLIHSVLQDYNYDVEKTLETLFVLAESSAADAINKKVPSFKDITAGLQKIKDREDDDSSSEEEEGERDEDFSDLNVNNTTNTRDDADSSGNTWDSSLDLPLLPKSRDNFVHPNVFKLSELQKQQGTGSGVTQYNFDSYYEAEYGRKMQPENSLQEFRYENGAQIDAMLAENKKWNYYGESDSMYQNQSQMASHAMYDYFGNVSHMPLRTHRAGNGGMVGSYPPDLTTAQGQMFGSGKLDSSSHRIVNQSNSSQTGKSVQLPGQTRTNETSMYRQNNAIHRASSEDVQLKGNSSGMSQKQTNSHANKQRSHAESSLMNTSTPVWPNKKTNIVPSTSHRAVGKSDHVTPLPKGKVLCLMRGLPGSGKSTLAKKLLSSSKPTGVILSTDDFFMQPDGKYLFNPRDLDTAHRQTQQQAKDAMRKGQTPVIIDNTNTQLWEMKPYVVYAQQFHYRVEIREPNTSWKSKVSELTRKNTHGVPRDKIHQMLDRFERVDGVESILRAPSKFQDGGVKDKMDVEIGDKSLISGKGRNPAHNKSRVSTQDRIPSGSISSTQRRNETPKSHRSEFTSGRETASSFKTAGRIGTSKLAQESLIQARQVASQNAFQSEDTSVEVKRVNTSSSTDSNLSEIQDVVTSIPLASCLQENMDSFQEKLKGINDISVLLDEDLNEESDKDKQEMETSDTVEDSNTSSSGEKGIQDVTEIGMEKENEREVEGSSSPEQIIATSYKGSSVDPPHYHINSKTISDNRKLASKDSCQIKERKLGNDSIASGDTDDSGSCKQSNSHDGNEFDKYLSPSKPDDGSSEPDLELDTKSLAETRKEEGLLNVKDEGSDKVMNARANSELFKISGAASSERSRDRSSSQDLRSKAFTFKEERSEGFNQSKYSSHSAMGAKESYFVPVEKVENDQKQFEVEKGLTQFRAKVGPKDIEREEKGSIKSSIPSNMTLKLTEDVGGMNVDTVSSELLGIISNWDVTGAKPKMKRTLSEPPIMLPTNPALKFPLSSPVAAGSPLQSLSTVPQMRKKHRRASTPFGKRILAPNFSSSLLPSVLEPDLVIGGTKSSLEEVKREACSKSVLESNEREDTLGERTKGDCAKRLSYEQLSENRVEEKTEQIAEALSPGTQVHDPPQMAEKQEESSEVSNVLIDSSEIPVVKPPTEISEGRTNGPKDTEPLVKRKTARHSKRKSPPLLDEATKLKAMTKNWSSGAITKEVLMPVGTATPASVVNDPEMQHHGSQTDASHFNLLERVNMSSESEAILEGNLRVRRVRHKTFRGTGSTAAALSDIKTGCIPHRRKIDKSCMTEESKMHNPEGGLDLLSSIFPHLEKEHIREVLQRCKGNAQWASEILVESNHVSTERRTREQRHNEKTPTQNGESQCARYIPKSSSSSQTFRADFLFLKLTMDNTKVPEEAPNFQILSAGEWKEAFDGGAGRDQASGGSISHVGVHVDLEEVMPNFDEDLSKLLQAYLDVPFMEVCEILEKNKGNVAIAEMEIQRKYHEEIEESPHSVAETDTASQEHAPRSATQHKDLSSGTHTTLSSMSSGEQEDKTHFPKMQYSSSSATSDEPQLQNGSRNKGKPQNVAQSIAAKKIIEGEQASLSDQESSYMKRGREMSDRDHKDSKRSHRGRSRSLPRKKPDSSVDKKSTTVGGSKRQKFGTNSTSDGSKRGPSQVPLEPKSIQPQGHKGATKVKHPGTEEMYKRLPDKLNVQNLRKRVETPEIGSSSARESRVEGAVGYDHRLNLEGIGKDQETKGTGGVNENQGEQVGAEMIESEEKAQEAVAEGTPSDLLNEVGKGVPTRFHQGMMFQLDMAFALQLQEIFGSVGYCIDTDVLSEDDLAIPVDLQLAKAIHTAWCKSFKQKFDREEAQLLEMMKQDEALAKRLQEEEEKMKMKEEQKKREEQYLVKHRGQQALTRHSIPGSPVAGHQGLRGKMYSGTSGSPSYGYQSPAGSLRDIMDDHVAEEIGKDMQREDALSTEKANSMAVKLRRNQLIERYPELNQSLLEDVFMKNNFDIDPTVEEIDAMVKTSEGVRNVYSEEVLQRMEEEQLKQALEESSVEGQFQQVTSRRSPKTQRRPQPQPDDDDEPNLKKHNKFQSLEHPGYHDYRAEANLHYQQRQECFKKASEAFRKGQRELAAYYSEEGHKHTALLQEANQRASEAILADKNKEQDDDTLDLHGLHVDEALEALETKMVEKSTRLAYSSPFLRPSPYLNIITGRGIHSKYGIAKIKPAVINFLKTKGYGFEIMNHGMIRVKL